MGRDGRLFVPTKGEFGYGRRPQQAQSTHAQETKDRSFPPRVPVARRTRQLSMFFRDVTDTNQSESHSGLQQLRFTRKGLEDLKKTTNFITAAGLVV